MLLPFSCHLMWFLSIVTSLLLCVQQIPFSYLILLKICMHLAWKKVLTDIQSVTFQLLHWWSCSSWNKPLMLVALNKMRNWSTVHHGWSATHQCIDILALLYVMGELSPPVYWHISLTVRHGWTVTHRCIDILALLYVMGELSPTGVLTLALLYVMGEVSPTGVWHISLTVRHGWTVTHRYIDILALLYVMGELSPTGVLTC